MPALAIHERDELFRPGPRDRRTVGVLGADPDLGAALAPEQWQVAAHAAVAPVFSHAPGPWDFSPLPDPASLGVLVLRGLIVVRIEVGGRAHLELLGQGDVISPWVGTGPDLVLPTVVSASVVSELRLALLDRRFALRTARWPEIHAMLVQRLITRARRLSLQSAINAVPRVEDRLELTLWQLASRFARVTANGLRLELGLTHTQLAEMIAAQRPSVTVALARLEADGRLIRKNKQEWLLPGPEPSGLTLLATQSGLRV